MNTQPLEIDIQEFLTAAVAPNGGTIILPVQVTREEVTLSPDRERGYVVWDFEVTSIQMCSTKYTNVVEGNLDVIVYASRVSKAQELIIRNAVLDALQPTDGDGDLSILGEYQFTNTYLHWLKVYDVTELFVEKTGNPTPETVGTQISCSMKVSL